MGVVSESFFLSIARRMKNPWLALTLAICGSSSMYVLFYFILGLPQNLLITGISLSAVIPIVTGFPIFYLISFLYRHVEQHNHELHELSAQKDALLSLVAHDIRSPLASLQQSLSYAAYDKNYASNAVESFSYLDQRVRNTLELLDSLLGWSRSQLKHEILSPIYPYRLADDLLKQLHEQVHAKSIQIDNRIAPALHLPLDDKVLSLVLRNLLINAIKFTPDEGHIVLTCKHDDQYTRIGIEDNGVGMNHETLQRLFSPHPVGSSLGTHGETGSGIGLLLCKLLLHSIKAEIHADSTPGHGSRFEIRLPA